MNRSLSCASHFVRSIHCWQLARKTTSTMLPRLIFYLVGLWLPVLTTAVNGTDGGEWVPFVEGSFDDENDNVAARWMYGPIGFDEIQFNPPVSSATALPPLKPSIDQSEKDIISSKDDGTDQFLIEIDSFRAKRVALARLFDDDRSRRRSSSSSRSRSSYRSSRSRASRSSWSSSWDNDRSSAYYDEYPQYNYGGYYAQPHYGYRPQYNYGYQYRPQYRPQYYHGGHRRYYYHG
ncbi:uncharacterized protein LOC130692812 [Daphnia carinata]|uniref:uncharacterized protein LOC130692812 n=1 Tax=Daphnia carinata TaxID=120202 RepID=UPI00257E7C80|nr:uncharacterized protein LOC130692812 [Daphnia carinata]